MVNSTAVATIGLALAAVSAGLAQSPAPQVKTQAPGFYRRLGFRSFGRIPDYPRGASRIFFVKSLKP